MISHSLIRLAPFLHIESHMSKKQTPVENNSTQQVLDDAVESAKEAVRHPSGLERPPVINGEIRLIDRVGDTGIVRSPLPLDLWPRG